MNSINEILRDYTAGETDLEAANAALAEAGAGFHLEPGRNEITDEDRRQTVVGYYPNQATGYGLLDTGTGSMEKVVVTGGRLEHPVNRVQPDGSTNMAAYVIICGRTYEVFGDELGEVREAEPAPRVQREVDMRRRTDLAGQQAEQTCRQGRFRVTYDEMGCAVKATRLAPHNAAGSAEASSAGLRL